MTNTKLIHPHDKFFKDAFSRIDIMRSFVEHYLLPEDKVELPRKNGHVTKQFSSV